MHHGARSGLVCDSRPCKPTPEKSPIGSASQHAPPPAFTTPLLVQGQIGLEISSVRDFLRGYREPDAVITMARFRTLSARNTAQRRAERPTGRPAPLSPATRRPPPCAAPQT